MKCPRDGTELAGVELLGAKLDKCHRCDGIWCDRGELERIRDSEVTNVEEALESKYGNPEYKPGDTEGYMQCPRCGGRLHRFSYSYITSVYIDRCDTCFGVWLDDTELDSVVSRSLLLSGEKVRMRGKDDPLEEAPDEGRLKVFLRSVGRFFGSDSGEKSP